MTQKQHPTLTSTVAANRWAKIKDAERVRYAGAPPAYYAWWRDSAPYRCPQLQHRSMRGAPPGIVPVVPVAPVAPGQSGHCQQEGGPCESM